MSEIIEHLQSKVLFACESYSNDGNSLMKDIETSMPRLTDVELLQLIDTVKHLALNMKGDPPAVNWVAGMMLDDFAERLKPYQHQFVDDFMSVAKNQMGVTNVRLPTLYFGLRVYDLSKHIDIVTQIVTSSEFEPAFNIIDAFLVMDYSKIPKRKLMQQLHIF